MLCVCVSHIFFACRSKMILKWAVVKQTTFVFVKWKEGEMRISHLNRVLSGGTNICCHTSHINSKLYPNTHSVFSSPEKKKMIMMMIWVPTSHMSYIWEKQFQFNLMNILTNTKQSENHLRKMNGKSQTIWYEKLSIESNNRKMIDQTVGKNRADEKNMIWMLEWKIKKLAWNRCHLTPSDERVHFEFQIITRECFHYKHIQVET